jgi:broad specificity phosphatase PhoE
MRPSSCLWMPPGLTPKPEVARYSGATAPDSHRLPANIWGHIIMLGGPVQTRTGRFIMLRLYLLAAAPTAAQRLLRFPADESIEPIDPSIARRLLARVGACSAVWRGPERRAEETAEMLGVVASPSDDLRAWSAGAWSGQSVAHVAESDPEGFRAWRTDPDAAPAGGESLNTLIARVAGWTRAQTPGTGRVLVIADPAVIRAVVLHVLEGDSHTFWRLEVPPLSLSVVQHANNEWRLRHLVLDPAEPCR